MGMLPNEIKPAMEGVIPSFVITSSAEGEPNATIISQVYYVDADHVALSFQFFNKTIRNVRNNPKACVVVVHPVSFEHWYLDIAYDHSETEGPVFDEMDMKIEAIASMTGMSGVFQLKAADIYRVESVRRMTGIRKPA